MSAALQEAEIIQPVIKSKQPNQYTSGNKAKTTPNNAKKATGNGVNEKGLGKTATTKEVATKSSNAKTGLKVVSKTEKVGQAKNLINGSTKPVNILSKKLNGGTGSDSQSGFESVGYDGDERESFWGLVRLFIQCHESENKEVVDFSTAGGMTGVSIVDTKAVKSGSANTGKKAKDKQSQVSNDDTKGAHPLKASGNVSNAGGGAKSVKGSKKKGAGKPEPTLEENKSEALTKQNIS